MSIDPATLCNVLYSPDKVGLYQDTGGTTPSDMTGDNVKLRDDQSAGSNNFSEDTNPPTLLDRTGWYSTQYNRPTPNLLASANGVLDFDINDPFTFVCIFRATAALGVGNTLIGNFSGTGWYVFVGNTNQMVVGIVGTGSATVMTDNDTFPDDTDAIVVVRHDGSGTAAGISVFKNGVLISSGALDDTLSGTSVTGAPCYLGYRGDGEPLGGQQSHPGVADVALTDEECIGMSDWLAELTGIYTPAGGGVAPQAMQHYRRRRVA